ncbi:hypothetical protein CWATWH8502_4198 [Crocosphaera watsonii WH 8502]|uniref:Uncharacterized protein n=2 Tax=Crocosphaera watsonii TaxID=263511 RepID=T2ICH7_CROWT|nr:hypothetical protein CWATWH8502_4198 [Crocosphaera watsonii WH 8502]
MSPSPPNTPNSPDDPEVTDEDSRSLLSLITNIVGSMGNALWSNIPFCNPKATVSEFVILLVFGLIGYGIWHQYGPQVPSLSPQATKVQQLITEQISDMGGEVPEQPPTLTAEQIETLKIKVEEWQSDSERFLGKIATVQTQEFNLVLQDISNALNKLLNLENQEEQQNIVVDIEKDLNILKTILEERKTFWSDNKKWVEVIFWTIFGTLLYLIQQTAEYKLRVNGDDRKQEDTGRADNYLKRYKAQYYSYILLSPFLSLIILFVLTGANFNIAGFSLALSQVNEKVLVSLAFILGYFNKLAITQINLIVASIFKDAWIRTFRNIDVDPSNQIVEYGGYYNFNVIPDVKVKWSILSEPKFGTIDIATGMFIAPPQPGYYCVTNGEGQLEWKKLTEKEGENNDNHRQVIIRAVREDEDSVSTIALITLTEKVKENMELVNLTENVKENHDKAIGT